MTKSEVEKQCLGSYVLCLSIKMYVFKSSGDLCPHQQVFRFESHMNIMGMLVKYPTRQKQLCIKIILSLLTSIPSQMDELQIDLVLHYNFFLSIPPFKFLSYLYPTMVNVWHDQWLVKSIEFSVNGVKGNVQM